MIKPLDAEIRYRWRQVAATGTIRQRTFMRSLPWEAGLSDDQRRAALRTIRTVKQKLEREAFVDGR